LRAVFGVFAEVGLQGDVERGGQGARAVSRAEA